MAQVCIVSSLHDGMNLVAKEYICAHCDEDGVLILSQFAGSARELTEATLINPYDSEQFSDSIYQALTMPEEERRKRMVKMRQIVHENNIFRWAGKFISGLLKIEFKEHEGGEGLKNLLEYWDNIVQAWADKNIILFLDYDGTLTPIAQSPSQAVLSQENKELLERLVNIPLFQVVIISGRTLGRCQTDGGD